jgi:HEAT repeat protein
VEALRALLQQGKLAGRLDRLDAAVGKLSSLSDLARALLLPDWSYPSDDEKEIHQIEEKVTQRFEREFRNTLQHGDDLQRIAAVNVIREMFTSVRRQGIDKSSRAGNAALRARLRSLTPEYKSLVSDPSPDVRIAAANALGAVEGEPKNTVPFLEKLLADADVGVRRAAAEALANIILFAAQLASDPTASRMGLDRDAPVPTPAERARLMTEHGAISTVIKVVPAAAGGLNDRDVVVRRLCAIAARRSARVLAEVVKPAGDSQPLRSGGAPLKGVPLPDDLGRGIDRATARGLLEGIAGGVKMFREQSETLIRAASDPDPLVRLEMRRVFEDFGDTVRRMRRLEEAANAPELPEKLPAPDKEKTPPGRRAASSSNGHRLAIRPVGHELLSQVPPLRSDSPDAGFFVAPEKRAPGGGKQHPEPVGPDPSTPVPGVPGSVLPPVTAPAEFHGRPDAAIVPAAPKAPPDSPLEKNLQEALAALIKGLSDPTVRVRLASLEALEVLGEQAAPALPAVVNATTDSNLFVRWAAARTLGVLAPRQPELAVPALVRRLDPAEDLSVQIAAATALQQYGPMARPAIPALVGALSAGDDDVSLAAYEALDRAGADTPEALAAIARGLTDPSAPIRREAARVLGHLGPAARSTLPALRKALFDTDDDVRRAASAAVLAIDVKK